MFSPELCCSASFAKLDLNKNHIEMSCQMILSLAVVRSNVYCGKNSARYLFEQFSAVEYADKVTPCNPVLWCQIAECDTFCEATVRGRGSVM